MWVKDLASTHQPQSRNPKFWSRWTGDEERIVEWEDIANESRSQDEIPAFLAEMGLAKSQNRMSERWGSVVLGVR